MPSKEGFGDFSSPAALRLASQLKREPLEIAGKLKSYLEQYFKGDLERIEIFRPGFINIFISQNTLINYLNKLLRDKDKFFCGKGGKRVLLEFVSANPTGPLSIAHGRQAVVGDVIGNIRQFLGDKVKKEYYINDLGRQIDLLVESVEARIKELKGEGFFIPEGGYQGEYIKDIAKEYLERGGDKKLRSFVLSHIISIIKKDLRLLGIKFDSWVSQKRLVDERKLEGVIRELRKKRLVYDNDGALWFASSKFGDRKDRVVKKNDGEFTYFASDIAYHKDKIKRGYDFLINLWGPDHHGYVERMQAAIEALGFKREVLKVVIIQLVSIKTKERMSRRQGTAILLSDLIKLVGKEAARFYYLTRRNSSHLEFDIELARKLSFDNPLYYIQYACARMESIFRKGGFKEEGNGRWSKFLKDEEEISLLRILLQFPYYLEKSYYSLEPVFLIEYLRKVAACFHKFYERKKVLTEDREVSLARLNLLRATRIVLHCALNLLGIKPAKRM
jgi:arginyl-tRNA synthetase